MGLVEVNQLLLSSAFSSEPGASHGFQLHYSLVCGVNHLFVKRLLFVHGLLPKASSEGSRLSHGVHLLARGGGATS